MAKERRKLGTEIVAEEEAKKGRGRKAKPVETETVRVVNPDAHLPAVVLEESVPAIAMPQLDPYLDIPEGLSFEEWASWGDRVKATRETLAASGNVIARYDDCLMFRVGDWLNHAKRYPEEQTAQYYDGERFGYSDASVKVAMWVCAKIPPRERLLNERVSFKHHMIVAKLTPAKRNALLKRADEEGLSCLDLKAIVHKRDKATEKATEKDIKPMKLTEAGFDRALGVLEELWDAFIEERAALRQSHSHQVSVARLEKAGGDTADLLTALMLALAEVDQQEAA